MRAVRHDTKEEEEKTLPTMIEESVWCTSLFVGDWIGVLPFSTEEYACFIQAFVVFVPNLTFRRFDSLFGPAERTCNSC